MRGSPSAARMASMSYAVHSVDRYGSTSGPAPAAQSSAMCRSDARYARSARGVVGTGSAPGPVNSPPIAPQSTGTLRPTPRGSKPMTSYERRTLSGSLARLVTA